MYGENIKKGQGSPFPYLGYWVNGHRNDFQKYLGIKKKRNIWALKNKRNIWALSLESELGSSFSDIN